MQSRRTSYDSVKESEYFNEAACSIEANTSESTLSGKK